jgi:AcrR family transcriptional regulator
MKRTKLSEARITFILRQGGEGTPVGKVCRKAGISEATFYNWRKKYGGLMGEMLATLLTRLAAALDALLLGRTCSNRPFSRWECPPKSARLAKDDAPLLFC